MPEGPLDVELDSKWASPGMSKVSKNIEFFELSQPNPYKTIVFFHHFCQKLCLGVTWDVENKRCRNEMTP